MKEKTSSTEFMYIEIVDSCIVDRHALFPQKDFRSEETGIFRIGIMDPLQNPATLTIRYSNFYRIENMKLLGDCDSSYKIPAAVIWDSCRTDAENPSLTQTAYRGINVNQDNEQYCQLFTGVFTASEHFTPSKDFTPTHNFSPSNEFSASAQFSGPLHEPTEPSDGQRGLTKTAIIGLSVALVVIVLLVGLIIFLCCLLKKERNFSSSSLEFNSQMYQGMESGTAQKMLINDVNLSSGPRTMSNSLFSGKSAGDISDDPFRRDIEEMNVLS
jgi:hypothetical protein